MTGLANRRAFREDLEVAISRAEGRDFALILADIDDFKPVNDDLSYSLSSATRYRLEPELGRHHGRLLRRDAGRRRRTRIR